MRMVTAWERGVALMVTGAAVQLVGARGGRCAHGTEADVDVPALSRNRRSTFLLSEEHGSHRIWCPSIAGVKLLEHAALKCQ